MSGVGIDLLEIERLERALERRPRLAERVFTDAERDYAAARARPGMHLAARFCAKEAVAKALGMTAWNWREVEVVATSAARAATLPVRVICGAAPVATTSTSRQLHAVSPSALATASFAQKRAARCMPGRARDAA